MCHSAECHYGKSGGATKTVFSLRRSEQVVKRGVITGVVQPSLPLHSMTDEKERASFLLRERWRQKERVAERDGRDIEREDGETRER